MSRRWDAVNLEQVTATAMEQIPDKIVYLNQQQLLSGKKADGTTMGTYRPLTIQKRMEKGRQTSFVDLFFEGNFQDAMYLLVRGTVFNIDSKDWKSDKLQDMYGEMIFGLDANNKVVAWALLTPTVVQILCSKTGALSR